MTSMITGRIERQEILSPINHITKFKMKKNEIFRAFFAGSEKKNIQVRVCDGAYCEITLA